MRKADDSESPFKKDEPVSRSRKWMLLLLICITLNLAQTLYGWIMKPPSLGDLDVLEFVTLLHSALAGLLLLLVMFYYLWRAAREAKQCQEKRNFDMMASAVRSQQRFWMLLAVVGAFNVIWMVAMSMAMQPRVKLVRGYVKQAREDAARSQQ
jgi:uncharacterized membrane-anchored protein